jgi:hypothetical protein
MKMAVALTEIFLRRHTGGIDGIGRVVAAAFYSAEMRETAEQLGSPIVLGTRESAMNNHGAPHPF